MTIALLVVFGIILLFLGGESMVRGAFRTAVRFGVSTLVAGLTVVSISTSLPEGVVSLYAQLRGSHGDIALGNVIGSNIANIGFVLGLACLIRPLTVSRAVRREIPLMTAAYLLLVLALLFDPINRWIGLFFVALLIAYIAIQVRQGRKVETPQIKQKSVAIDILFLLGGVVGLLSGAYLLIEGVVQLARDFGLSEMLIGLTIVAVGSSLPEFATTVVAAYRRHDEIAFGNVIGSGVFNVFFIVGAVALISPIRFHAALRLDSYLMLGFAAILWLLTMQKRLGRLSGGFLIVLYGLYITLLATSP